MSQNASLLDPNYATNMMKLKSAELQSQLAILGIKYSSSDTKATMVKKVVDFKSSRIQWRGPALTELPMQGTIFSIAPSYWDELVKDELKVAPSHSLIKLNLKQIPDEKVEIENEWFEINPHVNQTISDFFNIFRSILTYDTSLDFFKVNSGGRLFINIGLIKFYIDRQYQLPRDVIMVIVMVFGIMADNSLLHRYHIQDNEDHIPSTWKRMTPMNHPQDWLNLNTIKMYNYQQQTVNWMQYIESMFTLEPVRVKLGAHTQTICYHKYVALYVNGNLINDVDQTNNVPIFALGGILGHEMGIGKTACAISHIRISKYSERERASKVDNNRTYLPLTLILTPPHLCKQWQDELTRFAPDLNAYTTLTAKHFGSLTTEMLHAADVIVMPVSVFLNVYSGFNLQFTIRRLIIDEAHESIETLAPILVNCRYFYRNAWYMTGSPFPEATLIPHIFSFLQIHTFGDLYSNRSVSNIMDLLYLRMTKEHVKNELTMPAIQYSNIELTMSAVEKMEYNNLVNNPKISRSHLLMSATDTMISGALGKNDDNIDEMPVYNTKTYIENQKKVLVEQMDQSKAVVVNMTKALEPFGNVANEMTGGMRSMLTHAKNRIEKITGLLGRYEEVEQTISGDNDENECKICMGTSDNGNWIVYKCCTKTICESCFVANKQINKSKHNECPYCKSNAGVDRLTTAQVAEIKKLSQWGTKAAELIRLIRLIPSDEKIIIFSQFNEMLLKLRSILNQELISSEYLRCNVFSRNNLINRFHTSEHPRVLLLSSLNSGSGLNLTNSRHIFFMDIIDTDNIAKLISIESQAICRSFRIGQKSSVHVRRLIMTDTIEDIIYKNNSSYYVGDLRSPNPPAM